MEEQKAFESFPFDKENFESWIDEDLSIKLTDEQWKEVVDELDERASEFIDTLIYELALKFRKDN